MLQKITSNWRTPALNFTSFKQWTKSCKFSHSYQIVFNKIICKAEWWTCCLLKSLKFSLRRKIKWTKDYVDSILQVHPSSASICKCQLLLYNLHSSGISCKNQLSLLFLWRRKGFLTWEKLEDTQNLNKGCRFSQQSSIKSREQITGNKTLSIDYKQRPFRFNESHRNRESRVETQQLRIESRFWRGSRIECQLTFEQYCMYIYLVPCWEFNTKTSFLVLVIVHCTWGYDTNYLEI